MLKISLDYQKDKDYPKLIELFEKDMIDHHLEETIVCKLLQYEIYCHQNKTKDSFKDSLISVISNEKSDFFYPFKEHIELIEQKLPDVDYYKLKQNDFNEFILPVIKWLREHADKVA